MVTGKAQATIEANVLPGYYVWKAGSGAEVAW